MNTSRSLQLAIFLLSFSNSYARFDPDAGRVVSYTEHARVTATSGANVKLAVDNDTRTFWESAATIPEGYIIRPDLNGLHTLTSGLQGAAFDGDLNTSQRFADRDPKGAYTFRYSLAKAAIIRHIALKAQLTATLKVSLIHGSVKTTVIDYSPSENYSLKTILPDNGLFIDAIELQCEKPFDVFELAMLVNEPYEGIVFDFGKSVPVGQIYTRHMSSDFVSRTTVELSIDGKNWTAVAELFPQAIPFVPLIFNREHQARYLRILHYLKPADYAKAVIWEVKAYDQYGPYGKPIEYSRNPKKIKERMGINGIWGWGYNTYSDNLPEGSGAFKFNKVASIGRNYHELLWDVASPSDVPDYTAMADGKGTKVYWWLNWDREYSVWKQAGLRVTGTIMFTAKSTPVKAWPDPQENARKFGFAYARHFGKSHGNGLISLVEAGNEPWDFPKGFYPKVLAGMAEGFKQGDPKMKVLPAAFQATFRQFEGHEENHYITDNVPASITPLLDGLNGHFYSHTFDRSGKRVTVNPEDPRSGLHAIRNLMRWRDANMPGKPVFVTEYGFDSQGGGEDCPFSECVSEDQQAAWGLRAAMMLLRQGAEEVFWYFYANEFTAPVLHSRSGLTASVDKAFKPKASYFAFEKFYSILGNTYLDQVLAETDQLYAYLFRNDQGNTYVVAWSPSTDDPQNEILVQMKLPGTPLSFCYLDGKEHVNWTKTDQNHQSGTFQVKGFPLVISLSGM
jgi:hypothetical protein